jgi:hypothetical protein
MRIFEKVRRIAPVVEADLPVIEILRRTPLERLDKTVAALKRRRSRTEVRQAMLDLITAAPLEHFGALRAVFMAHCADED